MQVYEGRFYRYRQRLKNSIALLSSMRFAISLFILIAIASVIGTIVPQNPTTVDAVSQFGPFWYVLLAQIGIFDVYSTWWFLACMTLLVISLACCLLRHTPRYLRDMTSWKIQLHETSLQEGPYRFQWQSHATPAALAHALHQDIRAQGYRVKQIKKLNAILLSAKRGTANRLGYIFTHAAIMMICLGAVMDSGLSIRWQEWLHHKTPLMIDRVPDDTRIAVEHTLPDNQLSFKGQTRIPVGSSTKTILIPQGDGVFVQPLPVTIEVTAFKTESYATGMPRQYSSDIVVYDNKTKQPTKATIAVNTPFNYQDITIYQAGFDDGGSQLQFDVYPLQGQHTGTHTLSGEVYTTQAYQDPYTQKHYTLEWTQFALHHIEETVLPKEIGKTTEVRSVRNNASQTRDYGPSVQYRLRDAAGQSTAYVNYLLPVAIDDEVFYMTGIVVNSNQDMVYLRIPADDQGKLTEWMRLRAALNNSVLRNKASERYVNRVMQRNQDKNTILRQQLIQSAQESLSVFAGNAQTPGGFVAVSRFLDKLPEEEQAQAIDLFMKMLNGSLWELWQVARQEAHLPEAIATPIHATFMRYAVQALSDNALYATPFWLQLTQYDERQASILQVTRTPGKPLVYLGCVLLIAGICLMFYVQQYRIWIWMKQAGPNQTSALLGMQVLRQTQDSDHAFDTLQKAIVNKYSRQDKS